jgi:hypothetical protein
MTAEARVDGLFNLIKSAPSALKYEPGVIVADGDFVIVHGRFSGHGRPTMFGGSFTE